MFIGIEEIEIIKKEVYFRNIYTIEFKDEIIEDKVIIREIEEIEDKETYVFIYLREYIKEYRKDIKSIYSDFWIEGGNF